MKISHSTRLRIQLWHGAMLTLVTVSLLVSFWHARQTERLAEFDNRLQDQLLAALPFFQSQRTSALPPGVITLGSELSFGTSSIDDRQGRDLLRRFEGLGFYYIQWTDEGRITASNEIAHQVPPPEAILKRNETVFRTRGSFREVIHCMGSAEYVLLGGSLDDLNLSMRRTAYRLTGIGLGIIAPVELCVR
jgi:hypothetical protein